MDEQAAVLWRDQHTGRLEQAKAWLDRAERWFSGNQYREAQAATAIAQTHLGIAAEIREMHTMPRR